MSFFRHRGGFRLASIVLVVAVFTGGGFFALRGPYISNFFKKRILSEFQNATGLQMIAGKIYVNLMPPFIEVPDIKVFDVEGARVLTAERAKAYIKLSGLLSKRIEIERVVIAAPECWADRARLAEVSENVKRYRAKRKRGILDVKVGAVVVSDGKLFFHDEKYNAVANAGGLNAEVLLRAEPEVNFNVAALSLQARGWPEINTQVKGAAVVRDGAVDFRRLSVSTGGSGLNVGGTYLKGMGNFNLELNMLVESVKKIFGLKGPGGGTIKAEGSVAVAADIKETALDLKLSGDFYLETLMELLKAKTARKLSGHVGFDGQLKGKLTSLKGTADARLSRGSLFGVKIDDLRCMVVYGSGVMSFKKGVGRLYGGRGKAEASISIPKVRPYTVNVSFSNVDSAPALALAYLTGLGLAPGKVSGTLITSGMDFSPEGEILYEAKAPINTLPGKVKVVRGRYGVKEQTVYLSEFEARTDQSTMRFEGAVHPPSKAINIIGNLVTPDIDDLTSPYFGRRFSGSGEIQGVLNGTAEDPSLEMKIALNNAAVGNYVLGAVEGEAIYTKAALKVKSVKAAKDGSTHAAEGEIAYPLLADRRSYDLRAEAVGGDLGRLLALFGFYFPGNGSFDTEFTVKGTAPVVAGPALLNAVEAYGISNIQGSFDYEYDGRKFQLEGAQFKKGDSLLSLDGWVSRDRDFDFRASSGRLYLADIRSDLPLMFLMSLEAEGKGTFREPDIRLDARLSEVRFRDTDIGTATLDARLMGRDLGVEAVVFDGNTTLKGKARLEGDIPWSGELRVEEGRYDEFLGAFLKEVPEDLFLNLRGVAKLQGDRRNVSASVDIERVNLSLFGQGFANDSAVKFTLKNKSLDIERFSMRSESAALNISGGLRFGEYMDITIGGNSSLSPLLGVSRKLAVIKGNSDFAFSLKGEWKNPVMNGTLTLSDAVLGLRAFPQRLTSINGSLVIENNRVTVRSFSARLGGGEIELSGFVDIDGLRIKQAYLDALVSDATIYVSRDFMVGFGGNLLFRAGADSRYLNGQLQITKARYKKNVELSRWLSERRKKVPRADVGWFESTALNLNVYGTDNIIIDNNIARASLKVDMALRGTVGAPKLFGRVESKEGKVYFRNNRFNILRASADFTDPGRTDPFIDIAAESTVRGYHVWLNLEGRMEQFNLTLASDPPLSEVDILGLLTVGRFGGDLRGLEGGIGAAEATSFLTGRVQESFTERVTDITGLSRVSIAPYVSKKTGALTSRITASKTLMDERLFVTYSTAVGTAEDDVSLEWLLGKNVSLLGVRDERGSVGSDIKFRFQFK